MSKPLQNLKFWNFHQSENAPPVLTIYGEIVSQLPWWENKDDSTMTTHSQFAQDLQALGNVPEIQVRINSGGGDVHAANTIYTLLRDHKAKIIVKIDGIAASAATIIAMAGDVIQIPPNAYMMIHDPMVGLCGYVTREDCQQLANRMETIKEGIVLTYSGRTGMPKDKISEIMSVETWYTGEQAVEAGFCDELMFTKEEETSDLDTLPIANSIYNFQSNAIGLDLKLYKNCPETLKQMLNPVNQVELTANPLATPDLQQPKAQVPQTKQESEESEDMEIKNLEELTAKYPDLVAQLTEKATMAERERIRNIEEVALDGYDSIVNEAKFSTGAMASDVATKILAMQKKQGGNYLAQLEQDVKDSNLGQEGVAILPQEDKNTENDALPVVNKLFDDLFQS